MFSSPDMSYFLSEIILRSSEVGYRLTGIFHTLMKETINFYSSFDFFLILHILILALQSYFHFCAQNLPTFFNTYFKSGSMKLREREP